VHCRRQLHRRFTPQSVHNIGPPLGWGLT
jgi:hypothetical protein